MAREPNIDGREAVLVLILGLVTPLGAAVGGWRNPDSPITVGLLAAALNASSGLGMLAFGVIPTGQAVIAVIGSIGLGLLVAHLVAGMKRKRTAAKNPDS
jgi:hypothetical protein